MLKLVKIKKKKKKTSRSKNEDEKMTDIIREFEKRCRAICDAENRNDDGFFVFVGFIILRFSRN